MIQNYLKMNSYNKIVSYRGVLNMEKLISYGCIYITLAVLFILLVKEIIQSNKDTDVKVVLLALLNFMNYCLLLYCYSFVSWVVKFDKFHKYPYHYPFCIFVFICCIIVFVISGTYCIKYQKNIYSINKTVLFWLITHIVAILLLIFLRIPFFLGL